MAAWTCPESPPVRPLPSQATTAVAVPAAAAVQVLVERSVQVPVQAQSQD